MIVVRPQHPDLDRHDEMGLATDAELIAHAASPHGYAVSSVNSRTGAVVGLAEAAALTAETTARIAADNAEAATARAAEALKAPIASPTFTGNVTLPGDPTQALYAATKAYVDAVASGLDPKAAVRVATTANITLSGTQTIDGVVVAAGDRVLVRAQPVGADNGVYVVAAGAWARATDADTSAKVTSGLYTLVTKGTTQANTGWVLVTDDPITLGVTALVFSQFSGPGSTVAGSGLLRSGNSLSVDFGTGVSQVRPGNDAAYSDSRTPTAHASTHAPAGTDDLTTALSATAVPVALGTAATGSGTGFTRQGHVHPTTGLSLTGHAHAESDITGLVADLSTVVANTQTASYTLVAADAGKVVELNVAGANTLTVPPNSSVAFAIGTIIEVHQYGAGQTTITPGAAVTIRSDGAKLKTTAQYATASLRKRAADEWVAAGDLSA